MANNNKHTGPNVPALRFPEFSGEWESNQIKEIASIVGGGTPDTNAKEYWAGDINWYTPSEIGKTKYVNGSIRHISQLGVDNSSAKILPKGTILLSTRATIGEKSITETECCTNQGFQSVIPNVQTDTNFCYYALDGVKSEMIRRASGSTFLEISSSQLGSIHFHLPDIREQRKIGLFLSLLDERIETQSKIIEELTTLRSALHHQIMRNGLADGSWEQKMLAEVLFERTEFNIEGHAVHSVSVSKGIVNQIEYLGRSFAAKDTSKYHIAYPGDVVYTKSPTGEFPYGIVKQSQLTIKAALSPLYGVYAPMSTEIGYIIHNHFLSAKNALNYLHPLIQKGAKNTINITNQRFLQNTIPLPLNQNAADLYSRTIRTVSDKIAVEESILDKLQHQKTHFLQVMFI